MNRWLFFLLLPPALVCLGILAAIFLTVLALMPPVVSVVSLVLLALVFAWFLFGRRGSAPASETSLLGRQKSKEGLL